MILTNEEKRTIGIAAVAGAAILLGYYEGLPLWNKWTDLGRNLAPKLQYVARIQERAAAQNTLLARRDELAKKLGAVEGREGQAGDGAGALTMPFGAPGMRSNRSGAAPGVKTALAAGPLPDAAPGVARVAPPPMAPAADKAAAATLDRPVLAAATTKDAPPPSTSTTIPAAASAAGRAKATGKASAPPAAAAPKPEVRPPAATVAAYVERQAGTAGIRINSMIPVSPSLGYAKGKAFRPVAVQVAFETTSDALIKLLHALEKGDRLIRVEQTEIRHDVKKGTAVSVTLRIAGYQSLAR